MWVYISTSEMNISYTEKTTFPFNLNGNGILSFLSVSQNNGNPVHRKLVEKNILTICVKIVCIDLKLQVNYEQHYTIPKYYYIIFTDTFLIDGSYDLIYWFRNVYELARLLMN